MQKPIGHVDELLGLHDGAFVEAAYKALLDRTPDQDGLVHWLSRLRAGESKELIIFEIVQSPEGLAKKLRLAGVEPLCRRQRRLTWWPWRVLLRQTSTERSLNRLENEAGRLLEHLSRLESRASGPAPLGELQGSPASDGPSGHAADGAPNDTILKLSVPARQLLSELNKALEDKRAR